METSLRVASTQSEPEQGRALTSAAKWTALSLNSNWSEYVEAWLALQCDQLPNVLKAKVQITLEDQGGIDRNWPAGARVEELQEPLLNAVEQMRGIVKPAPDGESVFESYPILIDDKAVGAVGAAFDNTNRKDLVEAMRILQWGISWLRERYFKDLARSGSFDSGISTSVLDFVAVAFEERKLADSARALATTIAERFRCERVSLGLLNGHAVSLLALSHSAHFGQEMNLVSSLAKTMTEAVDETHVISYSTTETTNSLVSAHAELARQHGAGQILTVPLMLDDQPIGALCLERAVSQPFTMQEATIMDILATALAPAIEDKRLNERSYIRRAYDDGRDAIASLFKPDGAVYKFSAVAVAVLALLFYFWTADYEIVSDAVVEGREQRIISAGLDGYLTSSPVRPGDKVAKDQLLATLDDGDLKLELSKQLAERQKQQIAYEKAFGERNPTELRVAESRMKQADAQVKLMEHQLALTRIHAPFEGVIVSGDLSQNIGGAVERGEVLFKLVPADRYRVSIKVHESDTLDLREGNTGRLALAALPGKTYDIEVSRITPVSAIVDGSNVFIAEALPVEGAIADFRPGLSGAARIVVGERRVIWIWTHRLINWLSLTLWKMF